MTWGRREKKGEKGRKRRLGGSLLSKREMMGVHGRWSAEEIKDGVVRCGRIEVRLVELAAILHKAFGRKRKADNTMVL